MPFCASATIPPSAALGTAREDTAGTNVAVAPRYTSSDSGVVRVDPDGRLFAVRVGTAMVHATSGGQSADALVHVGPSTYDLAQGPPRILNANYIDLARIERISRFRSTVGHSYVDGTGETCRSKKHYYQPLLWSDWTSVEIFAPAAGTIWGISPDGFAGFRVTIRPLDLAALSVMIFHVNVDPASCGEPG